MNNDPVLLFAKAWLLIAGIALGGIFIYYLAGLMWDATEGNGGQYACSASLPC